MSYRIPILEAPENMDSYLTINAPMICAEDIVHGKLRKLYSDIPIQDGITVDPNELTLTAEDARLHALSLDPNKDDESSPALGFNVQKKATLLVDIIKNAKGQMAKEALTRLGKDMSKWKDVKLLQYKDGMTEEDKKKLDTANDNIKKQNEERAKQRKAGEDEKSEQEKIIADDKAIKTALTSQVSAYLDKLKGFDVTGET